MRPRWPEWVITLSFVAITAAGIAALWGEDLARLIRDERRAAPTLPQAPEGSSTAEDGTVGGAAGTI